MTNRLFSFICILLVIMTGGMLSSCNKDDIISVEVPPRIIIDSETGAFEVKVGRELIISPKYENTTDGLFTWCINGVVVSNELTFTYTWDNPGTYYIEITVETVGGTATEELRVEVLELCIPSISFPFPGNEISVKTGTDYYLTPEIANVSSARDDFSITWTINGKVYSDELIFNFEAKTVGDYIVSVRTENIDGSDEKSFTIHVVDELPFTLEFPQQSYFNHSTTRYTFIGRKVIMKPLISGLEAKTFEWTVNGYPTDCDNGTFSFTPDAEGRYVINVTVNGEASTSVIVECVDATEESRMRMTNGTSLAKCNKVYEWVPAPGQFIGETQTGSMIGDENTHEEAVRWAENRINKEQYVSLGGFGGYIIVGFDHSIKNSETSYDFAIQANAFFNLTTGAGGSNEPGIVYVSQDVNGNGLPDDEWYELRGSETGKPETIQDYRITYYRPAAPKMNVQWTDCLGQSGTIDYLAAFHRQDYYYPAWIKEDSYTLVGTRLKDRTTQNSETGMWDNSCFAWGYADNMGGDVLSSNDSGGGEGQRNGFLIKNAMYPNGEHINLRYIDFIKVQTAVNSKAGWLGEVSTEIFGFEDLNITTK